jgi:hypothetical protein
MKCATRVLTALAKLLGFDLSAPPATRGYTVTLLQQNGNVVAYGGGSLDLTDMTFVGRESGFAAVMQPSVGIIQTGPTVSGLADSYTGISGPPGFGGGDLGYASSGSGDFVGIEPAARASLIVPSGYQSWHHLSSTSTWDNQTFSSLGLTPGTYVWTWGTGIHKEFFVVQVGPERASLGLLGYRWRRRKRAKA